MVEDDRVEALVANFVSWLPLFALFPDAETNERYGVHTWTSSVRLPFFNGLLGTPSPGAPAGAIDELLAPFDRDGVPVIWAVPPGNDLTAELEERRFEVESLPGMTVDLAALPEPSLPPGVEIRRVDGDRALLEAATEISFTTNGFPPGTSIPMVETLDRMTDRDRFGTFLATVDGEPAAASALLVSGRVAGLYNVGTLPEFRRRGLGALVSLAAMQAGRAEGCTLGALQATAAASSVYRTLGFDECCRFAFAVRG